jgi:hypothetical protein
MWSRMSSLQLASETSTRATACSSTSSRETACGPSRGPCAATESRQQTHPHVCLMYIAPHNSPAGEKYAVCQCASSLSILPSGRMSGTPSALIKVRLRGGPAQHAVHSSWCVCMRVCGLNVELCVGDARAVFAVGTAGRRRPLRPLPAEGARRDGG